MLSQEYVDGGKRERCAVAVAELAHEGIEGVTTTRIIARARISRNTFYDLFAGRDEGLRFACELAGQRLSRPIEEASASPGPWAERVSRAIEALLSTASEQTTMAELCLVHRPCLTTPPADLRAEAPTAALVELLEQGRAVDGYDRDPPDELEELIAGGIVSIVTTRLRQGEGSSLPDLSGELVRLALTPYRPASERAGGAARQLKAVQEST